MNNDEVHKVISNRDPLFYWMHLTNSEQYLIPFICQRCGNCCRVAVFVVQASCGYFEEPNICTIYDKRLSGCHSFPVYNGSILADAVCPGYKLSRKAIAILSQGINSWTCFESGDVFTPSTKLRKGIAKLEKGNLPRDFINRFLELNS